MKLFYDDALIAAYMAREFHLTYDIYKHTVRIKQAVSDYRKIQMFGKDCRFYFRSFRPEVLIEPQEGDIIDSPWDGVVCVRKHEKGDYPEHPKLEGKLVYTSPDWSTDLISLEEIYERHKDEKDFIIPIIQRSGKPFFNPKQQGE